MSHLTYACRIGSMFGPVVLLAVLGGCAASGRQDQQQAQAYSFWPLPPDPPRVQFLTSYQRSSDVSGKRSALDEMIYGREAELPLVSPYSVAMWKGRIYVCDTRAAGVTILDLKERVTRVIGRGSGAAIAKATDIAIAPDGTKYITDGDKGTIVVFDANDRHVITFGPPGLSPVGIAVFGNELFVTDIKAQQVKVIDRSSGRQLRTIGEPGVEDGQFVRPLSIRLDRDNNLVVSDVMNARVQTFTREGKLVSAVGQRGRAYGDLARPKHLALDAHGFLYIVDSSFNNVQMFDEERKFLMYFGSAGSHPGAMDLPAGICVDEDPENLALFQKHVHPAFQAERLVIITNQHGPHRVAVYAQGQLKAGKTLADIAGSRAAMSAGLEAGGAGTSTGGLPIPREDAEPSATQPSGPSPR